MIDRSHTSLDEQKSEVFDNSQSEQEDSDMDSKEYEELQLNQEKLNKAEADAEKAAKQVSELQIQIEQAALNEQKAKNHNEQNKNQIKELQNLLIQSQNEKLKTELELQRAIDQLANIRVELEILKASNQNLVSKLELIHDQGLKHVISPDYEYKQNQLEEEKTEIKDHSETKSPSDSNTYNLGKSLSAFFTRKEEQMQPEPSNVVEEEIFEKLRRTACGFDVCNIL